MADKTGIEWTDATWNPVTGCDPISPGCKNCYAKREVEQRWSKNRNSVFFGRAFNDVKCHMNALFQPLRWKKPRRIFVCPRSDLFHDKVDAKFIADVFGIMAACPQHTFQILTKRPARALQLLGAGCMGRFQDDIEECMSLYTDAPLIWPLPNVHLGVSAEDQDAYDERVELLRQTPASVRWVSIEPMIGPIDARFTNGIVHGCDAADYRLDWVVVGGESGPKARPMHPQWARDLRDQCTSAGIPFLFKQWGEFLPITSADTPDGMLFWPDDGGPTGRFEGQNATAIEAHGRQFSRIGKKRAGRLLDGVQHDGYPEVQP